MRLSKRKLNIKKFFNQVSGKRGQWIDKNKYFYDSDYKFMKFLIPDGSRVLDLGCGTGELLDALNPSFGVGVDLSENMIKEAQSKYSDLTFLQGDLEDEEFINSIEETFDFIILSDTIGFLDDCENTFEILQSLCTAETRVILAYYSWYWEPLLKLGEKLRLKMPSVEMNWLSTEDTIGFLNLAGFETVKQEWKQLVPVNLMGIGTIINRTLGVLPLIQRLSLRNYIVARSIKKKAFTEEPSVTVLIPCKNERGNIRSAVDRMPRMCNDIEILFVEGGSSDGTPDEIHSIIKQYPDKNIRLITQDGKGKGDAVRKGFGVANGDILMILDADLTVPPEDLTKFYKAIADGKGEYVNGTRLVYPMESQAMRFLNFVANRMFSFLFTWLLNQRITDTLCGTKVISKRNYQKLVDGRSFFGNFDPFGDFDLILGSSKLNLKIVEVPIRYAAREYGETQISRFKHGWLLIKMVVFAFKKLKIT
jgi:methionine biosynthesis protein MetW